MGNEEAELACGSRSTRATTYMPVSAGAPRRIQIGDVTIQHPISAEGRRNIDLWTG